MSTIPVSFCPPWCDPRTHQAHDGHHTCEHRTAGLTWQPLGSDVEVTVATSALEDFGACAYRSAPDVLLYAEDTGSNYPDGRPISIEVDLSPADARMLAAALVCEAERVELLRRRAQV